MPWRDVERYTFAQLDGEAGFAARTVFDVVSHGPQTYEQRRGVW